MKKIFFILIIISFYANIYAFDLNSIAKEYIKTIQHTEMGSIGWRSSDKSFGGMPTEPQGFFISTNYNIYVIDTLNGCITVFDKKINFIERIVENENPIIHTAFQLFFDTDDNIITIDETFGIKKTDRFGKNLFTIIPSSISETNKISNKNVCIIEDNLILKIAKDNSTLIAVTKDGDILDTKKTKKLLKEIDKKVQLEEQTQIQDVGLVSLKNEFELVKADTNKIIIGHKYYTNNIFEIIDYFKKTRTYLEKAYIEKEKKGTNSIELQQLDAKTIMQNNFLGYVTNHTGYWECTDKQANTEIIIIISIIGKVLEIIPLNDFVTPFGVKINVRTAVAPDGDLYFMGIDKDGTHFYKITRRW